MPYIDNRDRSSLHEIVDEIDQCYPLTLGDMTYLITSILLSSAPYTFTQYAALLGVLEAAKLELYRRRIAPHEDKKCEENGDVY